MSSLSFSEYKQEYPANRTFDIAGNDLTDIIINGINAFDLDEGIIIDDKPNKCTICFKDFKHKTVTKIGGDVDLHEIEIVTTHKKCYKLMKKIEKLKICLTECEFELFCLRIN